MALPTSAEQRQVAPTAGVAGQPVAVTSSTTSSVSAPAATPAEREVERVQLAPRRP